MIEEWHKDRRGSLLVYTNSNTHGGYIKAAAVAEGKYRYLYIGLKSQLTVYAAELQGIRMGLSLAFHSVRVRELFIFTNNQATIQAIYRP